MAMACPRCGERTAVTDTRPSHATTIPGLDQCRTDAIRVLAKLERVGIKEWVARTRVCRCGWRGTTVELPLETIREIQENGEA